MTTTDPVPAAGSPELRVFASADAVSGAAAALIAGDLAAAIEARGVAHWATTGGSAAPGIYHALRVPPLSELVDWSRVHVWWGDDRFVPADHPLSNVLPLTQILLTSGGDEETASPESSDVGGEGVGVRIPAAQIHQIAVTEAIAHSGGAAWAAARYAIEIADHGPAAGAGGSPAFDVLLLGVGPDGHILSVFPGSAVWDAPEVCSAVPAPSHVEPHVDRVTVNPRLLAAARRVIVVSGGASKAGILGRAWSGAADKRELPVRATAIPNAVWLLDEAAAAEIPRG